MAKISVLRLPVILIVSMAGWLSAASLGFAQGQVEVNAVAGEPFGVGIVRLVLPQRGGEPLVDDRVTLVERDGRVLYPAYEDAPVRRALRGLLNIQGPRRMTIYFLFRGDAPLDLTVYTPQARVLRLHPAPDDPQLHRVLLNAWWKSYTTNADFLERRVDYPVMLQNYLVATLARRLDLPLPPAYQQGTSAGQLDKSLDLLLGAETPRSEFERNALLVAERAPEQAALALPEHVAQQLQPSQQKPKPQQARKNVPPPQPRPDGEELPAPPVADLAVGKLEAMAHHVPVECFYVRFGSFENYLWLRDLLDTWGGDVRNMVTARGIDYQISSRIERQLGLRANSLARLVGPAVIADVAIIGHDPFVREGAAVGIVFQARQNALLANDIRNQRAAALKREPGATEEVVEISGREVSVVRTPDNRVRSFYIADGDFHLVTTSRHLVQRFLEAGAGEGALAGSAAFQAARAEEPRPYTVFAFMSQEFFQELASPQYRIELTRRLHAVAEIEMLQLARLAATAEGLPGGTLAELVEANLLPQYFGQRADGSQMVLEQEQVLDSQRGAVGTFVPVADMEVAAATPGEVKAYASFSEDYARQWSSFGPIVAGIVREPGAQAGLERLRLSFRVVHLNAELYEKAWDLLGAPTDQVIPPLKDDLAWLQVTSSGQSPLGMQPAAAGQNNVLFGALHDFTMPFSDPNEIRLATGLTFMRGYLGGWPVAGMLEFLMGREPLQFDAAGYAPIGGVLGGWVREVGEFTVLSNQQEMLAEVTPQLRVEPAEQPANLRLQVVDLTGTDLAELANVLAFHRDRKASASGAKFMNRLTEQLRVPREEALAISEKLLDARLTCPLQGTYALVEQPNGLSLWSSSQVSLENRPRLTDSPGEYQTPLLKWFRGMQLHAGLTETGLSGEADLVLRNDTPPKLKIPLPGFLKSE